MGKVEIKVIGVIIMIMIVLSYTQAESDDIGKIIKCKAKCLFNCIGEIFPPPNCV